MELDEVIRTRRSIRRFKKEDIPRQVMEEILDLCRFAPSSMNGQPWRFFVIRDEETKKRLADIKNRFCPEEKKEFRADFLMDASAVVLICTEASRSFDRGVENGVLAASYLMVAAWSRGIGSVYMSAQKPDDPEVSSAIRELLSLDDGLLPISMIPLGYPDETPPPKRLRPLKEIIHDREHHR